MRVFPDTNVLVAAFATRGICADLLRHLFVEHELLVGDVVLIELKRILLTRIRVPRQEVTNIEGLLREHEVIAKPRRHLELGLRDADDEWIVASSVAGQADALVTGDKDILEVPDLIPIRAYTPRQFWERTRGLRSR